MGKNELVNAVDDIPVQNDSTVSNELDNGKTKLYLKSKSNAKEMHFQDQSYEEIEDSKQMQQVFVCFENKTSEKTDYSV